MTPPSESWFDRLAAKPHTRRQGIRAAAMGTAAAVGASLPFARSIPSASADANDCRAGCVYTANQNYASRLRDLGAGYALTTAGLEILGPGAALYHLVLRDVVFRGVDNQLLGHRKEVSNCFKPGCPGFDPNAPGGPCDGCVGEFHCNPCAALESGYICCVYPPKDCHGDCCPTTVTQGCP